MFAGGFGDAAILHAGGTSGLAGAAEQTKLQMLFEAIGQLDAPVGGSFDQMDSAARRFRLETSDAVGGTLVQAQAAVNALVEFGEVESLGFLVYPRSRECMGWKAFQVIELPITRKFIRQIHKPAGIFAGSKRTSPQLAGVGKSFAGLKRLSGSKA